MHTEFPYWLRWKNFTYRSVLSRSAFRVHLRFLRDDSLIFRGVLRPFFYHYCVFVRSLVDSFCLCLGMRTDCESGCHFPYMCVRMAEVCLVFFSYCGIDCAYVYGCMNEIKFQVCTGLMFNVGFLLNSFANKQGTSNLNKLKHSYYHSSFIVVY